MPDFIPAREYIVARTVLLDCLELLAAQSDALVLVGAQAIYLQTPSSDSGLPAATTDGDLAIDPELLFTNPDIAGLLEVAGFTPHTSPGRWFSPEGVPIDLMVPSGDLPASSRRTAPLSGQGASTARRTAGLELALHDNSIMELRALDISDTRVVLVKHGHPHWLSQSSSNLLNACPAQTLIGYSRRTRATSFAYFDTSTPHRSAKLSASSLSRVSARARSRPRSTSCGSSLG